MLTFNPYANLYPRLSSAAGRPQTPSVSNMVSSIRDQRTARIEAARKAQSAAYAPRMSAVEMGRKQDQLREQIHQYNKQQRISQSQRELDEIMNQKPAGGIYDPNWQSWSQKRAEVAKRIKHFKGANPRAL